MEVARLKVLLVAEPSSYDRRAFLHNARPEVEAVSNIVSKLSPTVPGTGVTRVSGVKVQDVLDHLPSASILHLACHGEQDPTNPLDSGFALRDGRLSIGDLMRLNLPNAQFAFLSACETAKGDRTYHDQAVHLAAAMLFVGFRSVIATLW
jgi:CHAT domain-containing protein